MTSVLNQFRAASLVGGLTIVWLAMLLLGTGPLDQAISSELYAGHRPILAQSARLLTYLGGWVFVTLAASAGALALAVRKRGWPAIVLFAGPILGRGLVEIQKYELGRLRPELNPHLVAVHNLSFPSGHSANAAMVYTTLVLMLAGRQDRRWWLGGAGVLAFCIGLSRIMLGVHWPSDVIAGWSFGLVWALMLYAISGLSRSGRPA